MSARVMRQFPSIPTASCQFLPLPAPESQGVRLASYGMIFMPHEWPAASTRTGDYGAVGFRFSATMKTCFQHRRRESQFFQHRQNSLATIPIMTSAHYGTVENNVSPVVEAPEDSNDVQPLLLPPAKPGNWKPPRGFIWIEVGA